MARDNFKEIEELNSPKLNLWLSEAKFGYNVIKDRLDLLQKGSKVLEIGSGSGILISKISHSHKNFKVEGIEPYSNGFKSLKELSAIIKNNKIKIHNSSYSKHNKNTKFDLIFCVNVFEHVKSWKHLLKWVSKRLKNNGEFVVLCPNYAFPYESHFHIPIFINKEITYFFFKNKINAYEFQQNSKGLWNSLNYVKKNRFLN